MADPADRSGSEPDAALAGVRSIARNTTNLAAAQGVGIAARAAYVVLVARLLGPELYALLAYSQAWCLAFLPLAMFGRGIVVHTIAREPHRAAEIAAQTIGIRLLSCAVACIACAGLAWLLPGSRDVAPLITVLLLALTGRAISFSAQDLFAAFEVSHHTLRQEVVFRGLEVAAAATVLLSGGGLLMLLAAHGLVWWLQAASSFHVVHRDLVPLRVAWRPAEWLPAARMARPFFLLSIAAAWRQDGPLIMFRQLAGNDTLFGQFALAMQVVMIPAGMSQSLAAAAQPVITRSARRSDGKDLVYAGMVLRVAVVGGGLAGLLGLALGPWFFETVFGARFAAAGELVGPALWCLTPMLAGIALPSVIMARNHFRLVTAATVASAMVMTALMLLLVPSYGAYGAILAIALAYAVTPALAAVYANAQGWRLAAGVVTRPLVAVIIATAAYLALTGYSRWLALAVAMAALGGTAAVLKVFTRSEREILLATWRERRTSQPAD